MPAQLHNTHEQDAHQYCSLAMRCDAIDDELMDRVFESVGCLNSEVVCVRITSLVDFLENRNLRKGNPSL